MVSITCIKETIPRNVLHYMDDPDCECCVYPGSDQPGVAGGDLHDPGSSGAVQCPVHPDSGGKDAHSRIQVVAPPRHG